jgi:hypothetical protein
MRQGDRRSDDDPFWREQRGKPSVVVPQQNRDEPFEGPGLASST